MHFNLLPLHGPHMYTVDQATWGVDPDLTITRYTEDCEKRVRSMQHLMNSLGKEARTVYVPCYYLQLYNHIVL